MEDTNMTINLNKFHLILSIFVILIPVFSYGVLSFAHIGDNTTSITKLGDRLEVMENRDETNREILLELKFNLKKHMIDGGEEYIERGHTDAQ